MNWRLAAAFALSLSLALTFAPAFSQSPATSPSVSLSHSYTLTAYGFGVVNDSLTFKNNGTSAEQIPTVQLGVPSQIASRSSGFVVDPSDQYSLSQAQSGNLTILTITPSQPTLEAGASSTVAIKMVVGNVLDNPAGGFKTGAPVLVMLSPSLSMNATQVKSSVVLPAGGKFSQTPSGFTAPATNATKPTYTMTQSNIRPQASAEYLNFTDSTQTAFTPILVNSLVRTIVPAANGIPQVRDEFTIENLAGYNIAQVHLSLLSTSATGYTVVPNTVPPLLNPTPISIGSGYLTFASTPIASPLLAQSNISLTISYALPASMMTVYGNSVEIVIPNSPLIAAPVANYTMVLASAPGVSPVGPTMIRNMSASPLTSGSSTFHYSVNLGWAADQAVPAAALVFAVAFGLFAIQKPAAVEEEIERKERSISEVLEAFEDKTGLESQYMEEFASKPKGSVGKAAFERMKNEVNELRSRALQRLAEMKRDLGSGRQFDSLTRVAEAEKEEDRAFRDLLNLYSQYHGSRMNEETFKKLLPSYRKRVDSAINKLSDLLHETQTEEK